MANTYVDTNPINLKDRIAALEQRTSTPPTPEASQPKPTGIPQLTNNVHLRDKIAKFERKGGVPVPRGRFGMGAPPIDSGKPKKQGELYGNRIPRIASASAARPAPGTQTNRRSMSLSVATSDIQDYDASTPRSISPCPSDLDTTNSEAPLSPDAEKEYFMQEIDSPSSPATEITEASEDSPTKSSNLSGPIRDAPEDTLGIPMEPNNQEAAQSDESTAPDVVPQVVVTDSASAQPEDASTVPEAVPEVIITGPALIQPGQASEDNLDSETLPQPQVKEEAASADDITSSSKAEKTEVEGQLLNGEVVPPTEPEKKHEDESVDNKVDDFSEAASVVEDPSSTSVSRSSSLRTLKPIHHATANTPTAEEETVVMSDVPVISLSPPPSAEDVTFPAVPSPLELYSPQGSERGAGRISTGDLPFIASPSSAASSVSSPVEVQSESTSPAEPTTRIPSRLFTRSPSPRGLPADKQDSVGDVLTRVPRKSTLSKVTTVEPPSEAAGLSSKEKVTTPTVTVTSPPASKTPDSAPATLLYGIPDKRASTPSSSVLSPPSISGVLSPTSDSSSATQSPLASPTETVSDRTVMATVGRSIPASLSPTNLTEEPGNSGLPAALSPTSPGSRFMNPPAMGAMKDRPNTFHAVVHSKVRDTAPALPTPTSTSQLLALLETPQVKKARQSGRVEIPTSPGTGELVSLLHEAALLENALAEGPLDLSLNLGGPAAQEAGRLSEEPQRNKDDRQRDQQRGIVHEPSVPKGDESNLGNLRSRLAFRLPLKKKTKHWKASSTTNAMLHEDLRVRRSLDTERLVGMSPTEPTFLKIDPAAAKIGRAEEAQPNTPKTPEGFRQDSQYKTPPKSPRLLASFRRLTSVGSTKSLHTSGQQPRRSGSTWSELSSEDSVLTPPDASLYFARSDSSQSYHSTQSHGANIPWPSMSPKRTIARAASFAEKLFNRGRTKSNGSTLSALSAQEPRGGGSLNTSPRKAASSVNLTSTAPSSFRLDLPSLTPSESLFDSPLSGNSPTLSLPNPYSPSPSAHTSPAKGLASTSALANRHFPGTSALTDNESWISEVSQLDPALFDAFPSVPEQPVPTLSHRMSGPPKKAAQHLPSINVGSSLSSFDPFFTNPPTPRSAQLPQRNGAQPLQTSASADPTFLASQRPDKHHSGR
ncbi:hypothetical protein M378DRAFT_326364 [Amanita muscaria Koide BX008]|uniref:Uncharacterized protein n=1 Tax=Amanita muscaria (strain Koide BX008) TaxID=946122 RepID=A0A0C2SUI9_AMAMK|nr:hypothetical protein M378DRAFT_326364 [Amanita muscaria Koide BX008]